MGKQVLVTGASGFVGAHLAEALETRGYSVLAMTRHPDTYSGAGEPVFGDVYEPASLGSALADVDAAYYLVHSLARHDFVERDAEAALVLRNGSRRRWSRAIDLSRRPWPRWRGAVGSLEIKARSGAPAGGLGRTGHRAAGGNYHWTRQHFVGDHPAARRAPSRDGYFPNGRPPVPNPSLCRTLFTIWLRCLSGRRPRDGSLRSADLTC
jgi:hypothetical protein